MPGEPLRSSGYKKSMIADIKTRQRALNLAGFKAGAVDGIAGPKTAAAQAKWDAAHATLAKHRQLDDRTEKNIQTLLPQFCAAARAWLAVAIPTAEARGYTLKVICGTRDWAEQSALYAKGRTTAGPKVTNARAGYSFHNFGCAFDIGLFTSSGAYVTSGTPYKELVQECPFAHAAVAWGGSFKSLKDYPHFEWHGSGKTTAELRLRSAR